MSKQRIIKDSFWTDPYIEKLDPSEKLVFIYLLSNPLCNIAGIYEIRISRIAYETGFDKEMVEKILIRFENDKKLIRKGDWLIIVNFVKNQSTNPSVIQGIQRILDELPQHIKDIITGCIQEGGSLVHFTLLNLTLLNSTNKKSFYTESELISKDYFLKTNKTLKYSKANEEQSYFELLRDYGDQEVKEMAEYTRSKEYRKDKYAPQVTSFQDLKYKWAKVLDHKNKNYKDTSWKKS